MTQEAFIQAHLQSKPHEVALLAKKYPHINIAHAIDQIVGRQIAARKLPSWANVPHLQYPPKISMEQCSSEATANFKASLLAGQRMADLSGGLGVDAAFFAKSFAEVHYVEMNEALAAIALHNLQQLGATNIAVHTSTAEGFLAQNSLHFDLIYLDPARRDERQQRLVSLADCSPNVPELLPILLKCADKVLVKASPLIDLRQARQELPTLAHIWVVAVDGECKEVLFLVGKEALADIGITAVHLNKGQIHVLAGTLKQEQEAQVQLSQPLQYLYEPHAAIMKAGLFKTVAQTWGLFKLHPHSHLYTSEQFFPDFPGRKFEVRQIWPFQSSLFKKKGNLPAKANLAVRNFPLTVEELRRKSKMADGGSDYIFATTNMLGEKVLIGCLARTSSEC